MITIVDYGCGNLGSIENMLRKLGADCQISSSVEVLESAERIILPGVGTFDSGMRGIDDLGLRDVLETKALSERVPVLGICLGAQLMTRGSEEGKLSGLGWLEEASTVKFSFEQKSPDLPLPNIGWRDIEEVDSVAPFKLPPGEEPARFYFVHKYHFVAPDGITWMRAEYGYSFACALRQANLLSVQFHPEKSHRFGMALLSRFAQMK